MSAPAPAATNAPASTGFLSGLFGAKKPANAAAPVPATGGRRRSRSRKNRKDRSRKDRSRKDRSRSRRNRK
jgi:hypothetical protein